MLVISNILSKWVSVWFIYLSVDAWQIFDHVVICRQYRNLAAKKKFTPWPIEMRFCEDSASQHKPRYLPIFLPRCSPQFAFYFILAWFRQVWPQILITYQYLITVHHLPQCKYWFRARGKLSDDQALHRFVSWWLYTICHLFIYLRIMLFCNIADVLWHMLRIYFILVSAWILTGRRVWRHTHSVSITREFFVLFTVVIPIISSATFCLFIPLLFPALQDLVPQTCEGWWLVAVRGKKLSISSSDTDTK